MEDSDENLAFASAMQYSDDTESFLKSPAVLQQQKLQTYNPPSVVDDRSLLSSSHNVIVTGVENPMGMKPSPDPLSTSSSAIPLFERIQQQKKQPFESKIPPITPPPAYAFVHTTSLNPPSNLSNSSMIRNADPMALMSHTFNNPATSASTDMTTSFLHHDAPVFPTESHGQSSIHLPPRSHDPSHNTTTPTDYKTKMYHVMNQAGRAATTTGYQLYHNLSEFLQGPDGTKSHANSSNNSRRMTHEMDYQRQSLLMDPHDDKDLYDDPERQVSAGNISDSLILDESVMNRRVNLHRTRQLQWQRLQQAGGQEDSGEGHNWMQDVSQCGSDLKDLYMSAPLHVQLGTVAVGMLIVWLILS